MNKFETLVDSFMKDEAFMSIMDDAVLVGGFKVGCSSVGKSYVYTRNGEKTYTKMRMNITADIACGILDIKGVAYTLTLVNVRLSNGSCDSFYDVEVRK